MFLIASTLLIPKGYRSMALFPFVLLRQKSDAEDAVLINHERIHLRQQLELLILPFYILYVSHYLFGLIKYRNRNKAYRMIVFEVEAYANESNTDYLKSRPFWAFLKYFSPQRKLPKI